MKIKRKNIINILSSLLWVTIACCAVFLLVSASVTKSRSLCDGVNISINGSGDNFFIDKKDIEGLINKHVNGNPKGKAIGSFDLKKLESSISHDSWIKKADVYFDNHNILQVKVEERDPVARVFSTNGNSFYLDSSLEVLPTTTKFSARVPVFTGFAGIDKKLSNRDSSVLRSIKKMSNSIAADEFLMAMIDQVDLNSAGDFVLIPKLGDQSIIFGDTSRIDEKFKKLKLFYKNIITKAGWDRYSQINLMYANQVVAKIKGQEDITADSLKTIEMLDLLAKRAAQLASDSTAASLNINVERAATDNSIILQSIEREDSDMPITEQDIAPESTSATQVTAPAVAAKPVTAVPKPAPAVPKPAVVKPAITLEKPRVTAPQRPAQKPVTVKKEETNKKNDDGKKPAKTPEQKPKVLMPKQNSIN